MQEEKALHTSEQERRKQIDAACATWIISHTQGPMYWLRNWTKTENYQWRDQGLNPVAPFPYKPWPKGERHIDFGGGLVHDQRYTASVVAECSETSIVIDCARGYAVCPAAIK